MNDEILADELVLAGKIVPALGAIGAELGCGLHEAIDEFQRRYDRLRTERLNEFTLPHGDYGRNVHT
ncbi:hypothetical protein ACIRRA_43695 [Nocardia sp. NPDC101769]|uniref:hypothetical protein n=1 Tax=Nocardia sp. NPDC101769 TaxID=3364333 RepID=UPI0037FEDB71